MSTLDRREVVKTLLNERNDLIVVAGLGSAAYDIAASGDEPLDFPLWGAMGGAAMVGLGLAMAQPDRNVLVITGDGEILMGLGSLATVAAQQPPNLRIVVLDNEHFGETGRQRTHTSWGTDLEIVARGCGIESVHSVQDLAGLERLRSRIHTENGPLFTVVKVTLEDLPPALPPRDGAYLTHRMRAALLGTERALEG